jgi:hypothetical protein
LLKPQSLTSEDMIQHSSLIKAVWFVEGVTEVLHFNPVSFAVVILDDSGQQRGHEPEGCSGNAIGRSGIRVDIVTREETHMLRLEVIPVHGLLAKDNGEELVVGDVLHLSPNNPSGFLEKTHKQTDE